MARAVSLAAACRPCRGHAPVCDRRYSGSLPVYRLARARCGRWPAPARSRQRPSPSSGDDDRRRARGHAAGSVFAGAVESPCRAHARRGARLQGGLAVAADRRARSLRAARPGADRLHRHLHRRRRRTLEAHRRGVRLAGRGAAGEFPRRRMGHPARLYRPAAGHSCRHASRRAWAANRRRRRAGFRSGRQHACGARHRQTRSRYFRQRRRDPRQGSRAGAGRHARVPVQDRGDRQRDAAWCRRRFDLGVQCHSRPAADHRARQGSRAAGARLAPVILPPRGRLRGDPGAGHVCPQRPARGKRRRAASALRAARFRAGAAAGAHQERRRPDHQGFDRPSLGRRRRGDDADRPRRGRQRGQQRAVRLPPARARVHQAVGAGAGRAKAQSRARCRDASARHHRARRAGAGAGKVHARRRHLSRPAFDLLVAHSRQERRRFARRGGAAVVDGGRHRGRRRFRRPGGVAQCRGGAAPGARTRRQRPGDQATHGSAARGDGPLHAGDAGAAEEQPAAGASARPQCAHAALAGSQEHARSAGELGAQRRQGCRASAAAAAASR